MKFDAAVVGAGVAGCVFAARLARAGHKVVVVESLAAESLGHPWWDTVDKSIFDAIGIDAPASPEARPPFKFNISVNGRTFPIVTQMPEDMVNIERQLFAARLVAHAAGAGVEFRFGTSAVAPLWENGSCRGIVVRDADNRESKIDAAITVDASGVQAVLRRAFASNVIEPAGFERQVDEKSTLFTYREVRRDESRGGQSVVCMGDGDSISWLSREPDGLADVFAGVIGGSGDAGNVARDLVAREGGLSEPIRQVKRWAIPLRRPFDGLVLPGFMLIGDSACMANAVNGSGISYSTRAALIAADTADRAIRLGDTGIDALWNYPARFFRSNPEMAFLGALKSFVFSAPRGPVLSFMESGGIQGPAFWKMRQEFSVAGLASKAGVFLKTKGGTGLLAPLAITLARGLRAESLYRNYPEKFDSDAFREFRTRLPAA